MEREESVKAEALKAIQRLPAQTNTVEIMYQL